MLSLNRIYFSPTKTTKKVLEGISEGLVFDTTADIDLTLNNGFDQNLTIENGLTIIGVPVYAGRVPKIAADRLSKIKGNNNPAILVVVYGNRHYDDALLELKDLVIKIGFKPVAAAAFIGEHSFSTSEKPIAVNRPDQDDLEKEKAFGKKIAAMLSSVDSIEKLEIISVPGNFPFKESPQLPPMSPETDSEICKKCGKCAKVCPTGAITINEFVETNKTECIKCCACVKACPTGGRLLNHEIILGIREKLFANCGSRKEPEYFIN